MCETFDQAQAGLDAHTGYHYSVPMLCENALMTVCFLTRTQIKVELMMVISSLSSKL